MKQEEESISIEKKTKRKINIYVLGCILIAIYISCQVFPPLWVLDSTTMKHYIFAILNIASILFLLIHIIRDKEQISNKIFKNKINYAWLLLLGIMIISFFQAMNISESIVTLNRWIIIYLMFIYFSIFLSKKPSLFNTIITLTIIISIINILWCIIAYYYVGAYINPRKNLYINGFYGNKNIFAAAILFKIPFLYYAFLFRKNWVKWLSLFLIAGLSFCLVILSARTSFIGFILILFLLGLYTLYIVFKLKKNKKLLTLSIIIIFSALIGFLSGDRFIKYNFNHYCKESNIAKQYGLKDNNYSVSNRFKSIEEGNSKGRLKIWRNTITIIKDKAFLGYGLGNHKLAIMKVEAPQKHNFIVSDHAHNDFLEMWSELGIIGLLAYLLLFLVALILFIKTLQKKNISETTRFISFVGFLCIVIYMNDAMFNFPLERADCQLYLALGLALILTSYLKTTKKEEKNTKKMIFYIIGIITIGVTTIETMHYFSSILQKAKILQTNGDKTITYTAQEWENMFPAIPNIDENANPIALTIGMRYDAEKKWRKAIDIIINDNSNPYFALKEYRLSNYYYKLNQLDSAEYWAKRCMAMKPLCYDPVKILYRKYTLLNEFIIADSITTKYIEGYKLSSAAWIDLINLKIKLNSYDEAKRVLDSALYYISDDLKLQDMQNKINSNKIKR